MNPTFASLSLAHLRTLDHLLQLKNLSHAAERLGVSQSALSRQLAHLREAFDDPLLVRQGRGYVLSEHAEALVEPLRQVLEELHALRQPAIFDPARCERRFCLAASDYVAEHMLPLLVAALEREAPGVSLEYRTWQAGQYALLASGEIDLATTLFDESPPNLHGRLLGEDRAVCLMRQDHPLAAQAALSQADYLAYKHVRISGGGDKDSFIDRHLRAQGLQRRVSLEVPFFCATVQVLPTVRQWPRSPSILPGSCAVYITWPGGHWASLTTASAIGWCGISACRLRPSTAGCATGCSSCGVSHSSGCRVGMRVCHSSYA